MGLDVIVAEDGHMFREVLVDLLVRAGHDVRVAVDPPALRELVVARAPDVAIIDVRMPPGQRDEGIRAAREIRASHASVGLLLLSNIVETAHLGPLLSPHARGVGYLLKDRVAGLGDFLDSLLVIAAGGVVIDPEVVNALTRAAGALDRAPGLTEREREVLALMAEGRSNAAIAKTLFVSEKTVEARITAIFDKLGIDGSVEGNRRVLAVLTWLGLRNEGYP